MPILEASPIGDLLQDRSEGIFEGLLTPEKSNHDKEEGSYLGGMVHLYCLSRRMAICLVLVVSVCSGAVLRSPTFSAAPQVSLFR